MDYETTVGQYYEKKGGWPPGGEGGQETVSQFSCPISNSETAIVEIRGKASYRNYNVINKRGALFRVPYETKLSVYDAPDIKPKKVEAKPVIEPVTGKVLTGGTVPKEKPDKPAAPTIMGSTTPKKQAKK